MKSPVRPDIIFLSTFVRLPEHNMQKRHTDRNLYFRELAETSRNYFVPFVEKHFGDLAGCRVLEIGCGDGGNLIPFAEKGCEVTGIDMAQTRVEQAVLFLQDYPYPVKLLCTDMFDFNPEEQYDIILVHDVIEHIPEKAGFIEKLLSFLAPEGIIYIAFPSWQMPFGGHQQICRSKWLSRLPYFHLLPSPLYKAVLEWEGETTRNIGELLSIKKCGISIESFYRLIEHSSLKIVKAEFYLVNPHYEVKFNLKPRRLNAFFSGIPFLRNFYTTSCFFLLKKDLSE